MGHWLLSVITSGIPDGMPIKEHLLESAAHMRLITMGLILLLTLRFAPKGLIPEK
jgi:branched-chain amino acid transport system permease protein